MEQEAKLLIAKAGDAVRLRDLRNIPKFLGFLSPSEASTVANAVKSSNCFFFGGYEEAERRMFGALPDYITEPFGSFPIKALRITYRPVDVLTHRDVLGSLMSTGVTRESVGDIRFADGLAIAFVSEEIAEYLAKQITKIGRVGVTVNVADTAEVLNSFPPPKTVPVSFTVSSPRLDAVISGLIGCSRSKAEQMLSDGLVFVNSFEITKATKQVKTGDKISIRSVGKFVITGTGDLSKKGREIITAEKYI